MNRYIQFRPVQNHPEVFDVVFENGLIIGQLLKEVDGYYVFYPIQNGGCWESWIMHSIARHLDQLNMRWDFQINSFFSNSNTRTSMWGETPDILTSKPNPDWVTPQPEPQTELDNSQEEL